MVRQRISFIESSTFKERTDCRNHARPDHTKRESSTMDPCVRRDSRDKDECADFVNEGLHVKVVEERLPQLEWRVTEVRTRCEDRHSALTSI